jgi:hypothetical protein
MLRNEGLGHWLGVRRMLRNEGLGHWLGLRLILRNEGLAIVSPSLPR